LTKPERQPRLVVFDCDGTLVDSQHLIAEAMAGAFAAAGEPAPELARVRRVVGLSLAHAVAELLGQVDGDRGAGAVEAIVGHYRRRFAELRRGPHHEPLFPGAVAALDALDAGGFLLGVATGKSLRGLTATLSRHGLERRFVTLQTADRAPGKPHPAMLERAIAEAGVTAERTVLVGDTSFDMEMAGNAGVAAIGVSWGYHEVFELEGAGAHRVIDAFAELAPLVARMLNERAPAR
jgi:phosphoglycolate phosphatase